MIDRISQNVAGKLFRVQLEVRSPSVAAPAQSKSGQPASAPELVPVAMGDDGSSKSRT